MRYRSLALVAVLALALAVGGLAGCANMRSPTLEFVESDLLFEASFVKLIRQWIEADASLSRIEKDALLLELAAWQLKLKTAQEATGALLAAPAPAGGAP